MILPNCPICKEKECARVMLDGVIICGNCFQSPNVRESIRQLKEKNGRTIRT